MVILHLRVKAPEVDKEECAYLDFDFVKTGGTLFMQVQQIAWDLLPTASQIQASYIDDEGDKCTLTEQTANDALSFAAPGKGMTKKGKGDDDTRVLDISVCGRDPEPQVQKPEPAPAPSVCTPSEDQKEELASTDITSPGEVSLIETEAERDAHAGDVEKPSTTLDATVAVADTDPALPRVFSTAACCSLSIAETTESLVVEKSFCPPLVIKHVFQRNSAKLKQEVDNETAAQALADETQSLRQRLEQANMQIQDTRQQAQEAILHAREVATQAEEDKKRHAVDSENYMQDLGEAKRMLEWAENARQESAKAMEQTNEQSSRRLHSLEEEQTARTDAEAAKRQAQELLETLEETLEAQKKARGDAEEAKQQAEELADGLQQSLAAEKAARSEAEGAKQRTQALADALQEHLQDEKNCRNASEEEKQHARELVETLQRTLEQAMNAKNEAEVAKQQAQDHVDSLGEELVSVAIARKGAEDADQHSQALADSFQQALADEKKARCVAEQLVADGLQQRLVEEEKARTDIGEAHQQAHEVAAGLQKTLAAVTNAKIDAEEAVKRTQALADDLQQALEEEKKTRNDMEESHRQQMQQAHADAIAWQQMHATVADRLQQAHVDANAECIMHQSTQEIVDCLQQSLDEEKRCRNDAECEKHRALQLTEGLQQTLEAERIVRKDIEAKAQEQTKSIAGACEEMLRASEARNEQMQANKVLQLEIDKLHAELANANERAVQAENLAHDKQQTKDVMLELSACAHTVEEDALTLGIEAKEDEEARGDVTEEFPDLLGKYGARQAFRIGRVHLPSTSSEVEPACARVALKNDGVAPWPRTAVIVNVEGDNFGVQVKELRSLQPGEVGEFDLDLAVQPREAPGRSQKRLYRPRHAMPKPAEKTPAAAGPAEECSGVWVVMDAATGARLGPLLMFEAAWDLTTDD